MDYSSQNSLMETAAEGSMPNLNLKHYWHVLLERRWLVIFTMVIVLAAALAYLYKAPRVYEAVTRLQIDRESDGSLNLQQGLAMSLGPDPDYLQTQYKNIVTRTLIETVIKRERLNDDPRYYKNLDVVKAVANDITISPVRMTRLVDIEVDHTNPKTAAAIANTLANEFIAWNSNQRQFRSMNMLHVLKGQADQLEHDVSTAEENLQAYRKEKNYVSLDSQQNNFIAENLSRAEATDADAKSRAEAAQTVVDQLEAHVKAGKSLETFPNIANDPQVKQLQAQLSGLENELAGLLKKYGRRHPMVVQMNSRIDEARKSITDAANQVVETLKSEASLAKAQEKNVAAVVKEWRSRQMDWLEARTRYDVLKRQEETSTALYNLVLSKMKEIDVVQKDPGDNIRVVDPAAVPIRPAKPNIPLTLAAGCFGAFALAIGLALFVNYLDDSIKSQDDVETYLRLPFLGYIPNIKSNSVVERYLQSHLHPQSNAAESFRTVRAAISLGARSEKLKVLTVTSTIPSEGKSLVASNLAIVIAQTGLKTLLIDADLRRPTVQKAFQLHSPLGLAAYLIEKTSDVEELVSTTEVPNLEVVCCGETPTQPSELIGSRRMVQFMQSVSKRYDRVIVDCPPVSAVSDPLVLSAMADGVVFIGKFNKVRREHARKSIQRIQDAGVYVCGVLLNDIDFEGRDSYYYSYYYYQNRYYSNYYHNRDANPTGVGAKETKV